MENNANVMTDANALLSCYIPYHIYTFIYQLSVPLFHRAIHLVIHPAFYSFSLTSNQRSSHSSDQKIILPFSHLYTEPAIHPKKLFIQAAILSSKPSTYLVIQPYLHSSCRSSKALFNQQSNKPSVHVIAIHATSHSSSILRDSYASTHAYIQLSII